MSKKLDRKHFFREGRRLLRLLRRTGVATLRHAEAAAIFFGAMPWKIERFNRLIEPEIARAVEQIKKAQAIVGIAFHRETANLPLLVAKAQAELQARNEPAAIVIVGERKSQALLFEIELPAPTPLVNIVRFAKPFGFGQKPGLSRRSWSHWAMFRIASRLSSDLVFIDADVRNIEGWIERYLQAIRNGHAKIATATYIRSFGTDDALVHVWDRLIFGALFERWIEFRQGGDYAVSRQVVPEVLADPLIMREGAYTLDSAVMAKIASAGGTIELVRLGRKEHEPIDPQRLFQRLPDLVQSVFDDIAAHWTALLAMPKNNRPVLLPEPVLEGDRTMQDLVGEQFREALYRDALQRFESCSDLIRRTLGKRLFLLCVERTSDTPAHEVEISARTWALSSLRFLVRYVGKTRDEKERRSLARAFVPLLEAGVLAFLNRTAGQRYSEAMRLLETAYLPAFVHAWRALARRQALLGMGRWRRWPARLALEPGIAIKHSGR